MSASNGLSNSGQFGQPLPNTIRADAESKFKMNFGDVHAVPDSTLAQRAGVPALTTGHEIHFRNAATLTATDRDSRQVLGHELAHVAQQGNAQPGGSGLATRSRLVLEHEAQRAGYDFAAGRLVGPIRGRTASNPIIQRYESDEHKRIGDEATTSKLIDLGNNYTLTYGDVVAMVGDYFEDVDEMRRLASSVLGREQLDYVRFVKVRGRADLVSTYSKDSIKAVDDRVRRLLVNNRTHFLNPTQGDLDLSNEDKDRTPRNNQAPRSGVQAYRYYHELALRKAMVAARAGVGLGNAYADEAGAGHYLTDAFSAGHVRTARDDVKKYWDKVWEDNNYTDFKELFIDWAARKMSVPLEMARDGLRAQMGPAKLGFGDLVGSVLHDYDNEVGLLVVVNGSTREIYGDKYLDMGEGLDLAKEAVNLGLDEVRLAYDLGKAGKGFGEIASDLQGPTGLYAPEQMMPEALDNSPAFDWKANFSTLLSDPNFKLGLMSVAGKMVDEVRSTPSGWFSARQAEKFLAPLENDPVQAMAEIIGGIHGPNVSVAYDLDSIGSGEDEPYDDYYGDTYEEPYDDGAGL